MTNTTDSQGKAPDTKDLPPLQNSANPVRRLYSVFSFELGRCILLVLMAYEQAGASQVCLELHYHGTESGDKIGPGEGDVIAVVWAKSR